jgi:hypothetical protein
MAKKRTSNQKTNAGGIEFQRPPELELRTQEMDEMTALRLGNPDFRMEINILTGPLLEVIQNATATRISYYPPEGQVMTESDRNLVGSLFLAGVDGDSVLDTGSEITSLTDVKSANKTGYPYMERSHLAYPDKSVFECTTIVFDTTSDHVAVIGCRANTSFQDQVVQWKEMILQDMEFVKN